jgi:CBS domain-containing protein
MTNKLDSNKSYEPYYLIPVTTSVTEALETLRKANLTFAVVGDINHPQTLLIEENLANLVGEVGNPLSDFLNSLPPLIVIDDVEALDTEDIKDLNITLHDTKAPGLVVYKDNNVIGVISKSTIKNALTLKDLISTTPRLYGDSSVQARTFICRQCDPPQPRSRPRQGSEVPTCPRNWTHGSMERE